MKQNYTKKRIFSLFMAVCMIFTMLPGYTLTVSAGTPDILLNIENGKIEIVDGTTAGYITVKQNGSAIAEYTDINPADNEIVIHGENSASTVNINTVDSTTVFITLDGATIRGMDSCAAFDVDNESVVNLTVTGTNSLSVKSDNGTSGYAALQVEEGATLVIGGTGLLKAFFYYKVANVKVDKYGGAAIGGGNKKVGGNKGTCGTITIGGSVKISASGNIFGAGIGGGNGGAGGSISIVDSACITALGGNCGAAIGGGNDGAGGTIKIDTTGTVSVNGGFLTRLPDGGYGIPYDGGAGIGGGRNGAGGTIEILNGEVKAQGGTGSAGIGSGSMGEGGTITINTTGTVDATGGQSGAGIGGGRGKSGGTINIVKGSVTAVAQGFYKSETDAGSGAGIGGGDSLGHEDGAGGGGDITISGGKVIAISYSGAGIGGGRGEKGKTMGDGGNITITGGKVTASSISGACIGGGRAGACGTIIIKAGDIDVKAGLSSGAAIGSGPEGIGGTIDISGGNITAIAAGGAAIGGGPVGMVDTVNITGGNIFADGNGGAGIGSGLVGKTGETVNISGGTIIVKGNGGAGIGSGYKAEGITVNITGGNIEAENLMSIHVDGAAIGSGYLSTGKPIINITGGDITAKGFHVPAIGAGSEGAACNIRIDAAAKVFAFSAFYSHAIYGGGMAVAIEGESTAKIFMANYETAVKGDESASAHINRVSDYVPNVFTPDYTYDSLAFTISNNDTYCFKTADLWQQHTKLDQSISTDFVIAKNGLTVFNRVKPIEDAKNGDGLTYTVTYYKNHATGGSVPTDSSAYARGASVKAKGNSGSLARAGYTWKGWNTAANGSGKSYVANNEFSIAENTALFAQWTKTGGIETYTVTYNANGATGGNVPTDSTAYASGANIMVRGNSDMLARTNYTWNGWNTEADSSGISYSTNSTFAIKANVTLYAQWVKSAFDVIGDVVDEDNKIVADATVTLKAGYRQVAQTKTDDKGKFSISGVSEGTYNLVITKEDRMKTIIITVTYEDVDEKVTLPKGKMNSALEVKEGTPEIIVDGLHDFFKIGDKFTQKDSDVVTNGGIVEIKLVVEKKDESGAANSADIKAAAGSGKGIGMFLDLTLSKTVTESVSGAVYNSPIYELDNLLVLDIPLPTELQGKSDYVVYRYHGTGVNTINEKENSDGEKIVVSSDKKSIKLYTQKFSTYAIAYTVSTNNNNNNDNNDDDNNGNTNTVSVITADSNTDVKKSGLPYYMKDGKKVFIGFTAVIDNKLEYIAPDGVTVQFEENPKNFTDIENHWAKANIDFVTEREIFEGTAPNIYNPQIGMTRGMFVAVVGRLYERSYGSITGNTTFTDVNPNAYYADYVAWAHENGIVKGFSNTQYAPDEEITREQMAAIMFRFATFLDKAPKGDWMINLTFGDKADISDWAMEAAAYCQLTGVISGLEGGEFVPKATATRAEVAAVIERFVNKMLK